MVQSRWFVLAGALMAIAGHAHSASVTLQNATATFSQSFDRDWNVAEAVDGVVNGSNGWAIFPNVGPQTAAFETSTNLFAAGGSFTFTLLQIYGGQHTLGRFRFSATTDDRSLFADGLATGGDVTANWTVLTLNSMTSTGGASMSRDIDGWITASGNNPDTATYTITASTLLSGVTGLRLEVGGPAGRQPNGNFVLSEMMVDAVASAVPEASTELMMGAGLLVMLGLVSRRRHSASQPE